MKVTNMTHSFTKSCLCNPNQLNDLYDTNIGFNSSTVLIADEKKKTYLKSHFHNSL